MFSYICLPPVLYTSIIPDRKKLSIRWDRYLESDVLVIIARGSPPYVLADANGSSGPCSKTVVPHKYAISMCYSTLINFEKRGMDQLPYNFWRRKEEWTQIIFPYFYLPPWFGSLLLASSMTSSHGLEERWDHEGQEKKELREMGGIDQVELDVDTGEALPGAATAGREELIKTRKKKRKMMRTRGVLTWWARPKK